MLLSGGGAAAAGGCMFIAITPWVGGFLWVILSMSGMSAKGAGVLVLALMGIFAAGFALSHKKQ